MKPLLVNYCLECAWSASAVDHTRKQQAALAVEHAVTTGHDIDSYREADASEESDELNESDTGWADEWPPSREDG